MPHRVASCLSDKTADGWHTLTDQSDRKEGNTAAFEGRRQLENGESAVDDQPIAKWQCHDVAGGASLNWSTGTE
ncbi:hypothetical protein [Thiospirillum jenense]|uniref:Uncharacterized protein n=1 Tax=Thiospirillum jenense TaxID=1653858 RepID=A0A839H8H5_9GAMM|nr:hypothetical protein [Thiospirillum jenense]MBB1124910.1 hypothetical protein [Thiospirillum jenense]